MTFVLVADPPHHGALPRLADATPLSDADAADLSRAMLRDVASAIADSNAPLLVNFPPAEESHSDDPEADLREVLSDVAPDARYEVQVGSSFAARAGNAITHLLDDEDRGMAGVVRADAPLLTRSAVDEAMMRLRRDEVALGPAREGRVYLAGFRAPVDFSDAFAPPSVRTLAERARDADRDVGFLPVGLRVTAPTDLRTLVAVVEAHRAGGRAVPDHTTAWIDDLGLDLVADGDETRLVRA
ncbi:MAG: DUF2064 domain-containing protein [Halobacteriaceae archaeon]